MKPNEVKQVSPLEPKEEGVKVYLAKLPEFIEGEKGNSYKLEWIEKETGKTFSANILDPYSSKIDNENLIAAGYNKLFNLFRAYMTPENYNIYGETDMPDLKSAIATGLKLIAGDWANTETTLLFGYSLYNGFPSLPTFVPYISTKYAEVDLKFPHSDLSVEYVKDPVKPRPARGAAGAKPDQESKPKVNDEV